MHSFMSLLGEQVLPATSVNRTVGIIVWVGVIVFTLAFFVLSWTKLGSARPLVKCLTLSVFAHILLAVFFYGTKMLGLEMEMGGNEPVTISLISEAFDEVGDTDQTNSKAPELADAFPQGKDDEVLTETISTKDDSISADSVIDEVEELGDFAKEQNETAETAEPESQIEPVPVPPLEANSPAVGQPISEADTRLGEESVGNNSEAVEVQVAEEEAVSEALGNLASTDDVIQQVATADAGSPVKPPALKRASDPRRLDGGEIHEAYQARFRDSEDEQLRGAAFGATLETEASVRSGVEWLVRAQKENGRWDASEYGAGVDRQVDGQGRGSTGANADTGISGLALLALMGDGHTHLFGQHRVAVQHGLEYLLGQQGSDGNLSGNASLFARMYCHAMATIAVCEAYALTGDRRLRDYAERAIAFTIRSQDLHTGGWRYQPADAGDMSQFGWQVLALRSAQQAGLVVPASTKTRMVKFLATCNTGAKGGLASYRPGFGATRTMTSESLACRMWLDAERNMEQVQEATDYILKQLPSQTRPDLYYWYYGSLALRQAGGPGWQTWSSAMSRVVPALQLSDGSWAADTKWGGYGGKVYSTAMAVLCLESFYRYQ